MKTANLVRYLKRVVDWPRVFRFIHKTGKAFDHPQRRALKGELFERAITDYSNSKIEYIGHTTNDGDLKLTYNGVIIEQKFQNNSIFSNRNVTRIKLMGKAQGPGSVQDIKKKGFSHLMLIDEYGCGLLSKQYVCNHLKLCGRMIYLIIKPQDVSLIAGPYPKPSNISEINFDSWIYKMIRSVK